MIESLSSVNVVCVATPDTGNIETAWRQTSAKVFDDSNDASVILNGKTIGIISSLDAVAYQAIHTRVHVIC
ncbi:hypothetical protein E2C01_038882 [Portunus trituberculatus]|uniref:Uncharacterized protein n=1 Tax=Portunus trituberculatus TaxID=210409 RepID=A0A5B7FFC2_PORTR|nr:hypothetical protein [Portunus trituberculatus]